MNHTWDDTTDFTYCTLTGCAAVSGSVTLSSSVSGSIVSDIRDSTRRFDKYGAIAPTTTVPANTAVELLYRTGSSATYDEDYWTDWIETSAPQTLTEYSLTVYDSRAFTDYDIESVTSVFLERLYRDGTAVSGSSYDYNVDSTFSDNKILLATEVDSSENIAIRYVPVNHIIQNNRQYIQWKTNLTTTVSGSTPTVSQMDIEYRLDHSPMIARAFPSVYRRI